MATEAINESPQANPDCLYDTASLRLTQAAALIRIIGVAVQYCPGEGLPIEDASGGVVHLLEEAGGLFRCVQGVVTA